LQIRKQQQALDGDKAGAHHLEMLGCLLAFLCGVNDEFPDFMLT
jgi:hypothetical protein